LKLRKLTVTNFKIFSLKFEIWVTWLEKNLSYVYKQYYLLIFIE
jgi:hypothetical protein